MSRAQIKSLIDQVVREGLNPYAELGVRVDITDRDLKLAWRRVALARHPDHGGDAAAFQRASFAYSVLKDSQTRAVWDGMLLLARGFGAVCSQRRPATTPPNRPRPSRRRPSERDVLETYLRSLARALHVAAHGRPPHLPRTGGRCRVTDKQIAFLRKLWHGPPRWLAFVPTAHQAGLRAAWVALESLTTIEASLLITVLKTLRQLRRWPDGADLVATLEELRVQAEGEAVA